VLLTRSLHFSVLLISSVVQFSMIKVPPVFGQLDYYTTFIQESQGVFLIFFDFSIILLFCQA